MLRLVKIGLVVLAGLWGLMGGVGNLFGYGPGHAQVVSVMAREGVIPGGGPFVAMTHPVLTHLGYSVIWLGKLISAALCFWGAARLWQARNQSADQFHQAKTIAMAGLGVALVMLFGGFIVAGGVYFALWSSSAGQSIHAFATQLVVSIGLVAVFVGLEND